MAKEFDVAIINNKIVLLDADGSNLTEVLESSIKSRKRFNLFFYSMVGIFVGIILRFVVGFFYKNDSQVEFGVLSGISFFSFLFLVNLLDEYEKQSTKIKNQFNKANLILEKEIFEAKKRLKNQENELQALKIDNGFFKKEKSINE